MTNKKCHTVGTVQNSLEKLYKDAKLITLAHKYMNAHFHGLVQALQ